MVVGSYHIFWLDEYSTIILIIAVLHDDGFEWRGVGHGAVALADVVVVGETCLRHSEPDVSVIKNLIILVVSTGFA